MSTAASIANFYVGRDGRERPIRFKAADLVNKPAPAGYHWEWAHPHQPHPSELIGDVWGVALNHDYANLGVYDYYVCVPDATP